MEMVYLHDQRPWMIGFSGGKDSTLLCCLVMEMLKRLNPEKRTKKVYIVSSDTMVENPIVRNYMHKMSELINSVGEEFNIVTDIIYPKTEDTFWSKENTGQNSSMMANKICFECNMFSYKGGCNC